MTRPRRGTARAMGLRTPFRRCSACCHAWPSRNAFLSDPAVTLVGYQVNYGDLSAGYFLFNHTCRTTLAIRAAVFQNLHRGPIFRERASGTAQCAGYCTRRDDLSPCPTRCECAFVRDILQIVKAWPKRPGVRSRNSGARMRPF